MMPGVLGLESHDEGAFGMPHESSRWYRLLEVNEAHSGFALIT